MFKKLSVRVKTTNNNKLCEEDKCAGKNSTQKFKEIKSHIMFRRVLRDIDEHGRDQEHVLHHYTSLVKPAFEEFVIPTKKYADVIVPRGAENVVAIDLIKQHIQVK